MEIVVNDQVHLSEFRPWDKDALVEHLKDRTIYERTLRIPFPYTEAHADEWLALVVKSDKEHGRQLHWAIRTTGDFLIGGFGFEGFQAGKSHRCEIGYWLATPFWGRGIMTAVVQRMCRYAFEELGQMKITAEVFTYNTASARVLEKCGFEQEGLFRRHILKDGQFLDARVFGLLK